MSAFSFDELLQQAKHRRHRALLVLAGSATWCRAQASVLVAETADSVWVGAGQLPASQCRQLLGSEYAVAVFDGHDGLHPDALAAVAGTVVAGGALILLVPPLAQWANTPDPDYERLASYPYAWRSLSRHFLSHVCRVLHEAAAQPGCLLWSETERDVVTKSLPWPVLAPFTQFAEPSQAQYHGLQQLAAHQGVSVLLAGRGHGKSALLGFAARQYAQAGKRVLLVAPSRAAAASVFRHADEKLMFSAPDVLLQDMAVDADVLLVDEAAAIPLGMLRTLLLRFPHAVLATTTDGYEGTGQGFVLRFLRELDTHSPHWQRVVLEQPLRWAKDDPVERWLYSTLLLDVQEPVLDVLPNVDGAVFERIDQSSLGENAFLLTEIYGLLRSAHYRTTPDDLRFLLDAPSLSVYRLVLDEKTVAVVMLVEEGSVDEVMTIQIAAGKRRPRGHLLVQTLAIHEKQPQYLRQRVARVVRIAVHTSLQGKGLGSQLLQAVVADQKARGVDAIGSSFSATPEVLAFWQRNGFHLMRMGHKRQAASAAPSAVVLRHL